MLDKAEDDDAAAALLSILYYIMDTTLSVHTLKQGRGGGGGIELGICLPGQLYEGSVGQFPSVSRGRCS